MASYIDITFANFGKYDILKVIKCLEANSWSHECFGEIQYLPLSDGDNYAWESEPLDGWSRVQMVLQQKVERLEQIGIGLTYLDSKRGGNFVVTPDGELQVMLFADRPLITSQNSLDKHHHQLTDFSWYIERLVLPLRDAELYVEYVKYWDVSM